ncbi:MAG: ABC transporter permease [Bacteroidetes bacterium]|nr:MAG: ABC transporter permease [Bacteroidota bacterium]
MKIILAIIQKEFWQLRRDKRMLVLSFLAPLLQLILLGYAATTDIREIPFAVYDLDKTAQSREFASQFTNSGYFTFQTEITSYKQIDDEIEHGVVWIVLVIPPNFGRDIQAQRTVPIQLIADGSDGNSAGISLGYASQIIAKYSKTIMLESLERRGSAIRPVSFSPQTRVWYNAELKSKNFMVPGVVAMVLMIVTMTLTSIGIVKEKESGTLEQLLVTPIKPYQLMLGKLLPFVLIGLIDVSIVLTVARFWFEIPMRGNLLLLYGLSGLFVMTTLGLGLFVSTISRNQQQAMMTAQFFIFMPFIFLSGFTFPIENMPEVIQYITYVIPLRYYVTIIRGILLKGNGISELLPEAFALLIFGISILTLSVLRFRRRLE